nr:hypothetical protein [uncultured Anaeromusa sp.]
MMHADDVNKHSCRCGGIFYTSVAWGEFAVALSCFLDSAGGSAALLYEVERG